MAYHLQRAPVNGIVGSSSGLFKQQPAQQIKAVGITSNQNLPMPADSFDINQCIALLNSPQLKMQGLETLGTIIQSQGCVALFPQNFNQAGGVSNLFRGIRSCLQINENQIDILMKVNQVLYDLMPDLNKMPPDIQTEINALIPFLIENLGNPKPNVRKSTHKCIGTFVKFSKKLEHVLMMIIQSGLNSQNQRTRQHSMLVIPALVSLKPVVINEVTPEMISLMDEITMRLRDPAENVAKTAKKLILELHKCYPATFDKNYVETKDNEDEKQICRLIMANNFDESQKLINQTSPSKRMQIQQQQTSIQQTANVKAQQQAAAQPQQLNFGAIGRAIQQETQPKPIQVQAPILPSKPLENVQSPLAGQKSFQSNQLISQPRDLSVIGREIMAFQPANKIKSGTVDENSTFQQSKLAPKFKQPDQRVETEENFAQLRQSKDNVKIPANNSNMQRVFSEQIPQSEPLMALLKANNEAHQQTPAKQTQEQKNLLFGFLPQEVVAGLNEMNQWKDRTTAMESIQSQFEKLLLNKNDLKQFEGEHATEFLGFILKFIPDINFKISIAAIKIVSLLYEERIVNLGTHYTEVVKSLVEKLSDSKQSIRDITLECCTNIIKVSQPATFASSIFKDLQHANWHVREGVVQLLVRCLLMQVQSKDGVQLATNPLLIEELCFLVKVEDKKNLQAMGVDCLALMMVSSPNKQKTENQIIKELGIQAEFQGIKKTREDQIFDQILQRINQNALPTLLPNNTIEFKPATLQTSNQAITPSTNFMQFKQQALSPQPEPTQQSVLKTELSDLQPPKNGPSSQMKTADHALKNQLVHHNTIKTPSMVFLENKRREEEKNVLFSQQQIAPESAGVKSLGDNPFQIQTNHGSQTPQSTVLVIPSKTRNDSEENSSENQQKISMWLPSFTPVPQQTGATEQIFRGKQSNSVADGAVYDQKQKVQDFNAIQSSSPQNYVQSPQLILNKSHRGQDVQVRSAQLQVYNLSATASSAATFLNEDGLNLIQSANIAHSANPGSVNNTESTLQNNLQSGVKTRGQASSNGFRQPLVGNQLNNRTTDSQSDFQRFSQNQIELTGHQQTGYVPEAHTGKARSIQSGQINYVKRDDIQIAERQDNQSSAGSSSKNLTSLSTVGNSKGFDRSQITDRLQILKSTNKYKQKIEGFAGPSGAQGIGQDQYSDIGSAPAITNLGSNEDDEDSTFNKNTTNTTHPHSLYSDQRPIKATHLKMPSEEIRQQVGQKKMSAGLPTNVQLKQQRTSQQMAPLSNFKQPAQSQYSAFTDLQRGPGITQQEDYSRSSSIDYQPPAHHVTQLQMNVPQARQNSQTFSVIQSEKKPPIANNKFENLPSGLANAEVNYDVKEEPLLNPEKQIREAIDNLKSSDWSKQFDACNTLKRAMMFHKGLFENNSTYTAQFFKDIVKPVDSLRSQVSKNACMALSTAFCELAPRETDAQIEGVMPVLLKRATDTNHFISQEADRTLIAICNNCAEVRVFNALQAQTLKSAPYKEKICLCYTVLIERLSDRVKHFKEVERLIQTIVRFLSEGAAEVRNQAKYAVLTLQSVCGSQRELDGLLLKCRLNENQMEKVRNVLQKEDFESLSNYANTRYGASMRASPMGAARHTQYGITSANSEHKISGQSSQGVTKQQSNQSQTRWDSGVAGSDGFKRSIINNMQHTFMSSGVAGVAGNPDRQLSKLDSISNNGKAIGNQNLSVNIQRQTHVRSVNGNDQDNSAGFANSQGAFKKRTTSVSKPVDKTTMETFKTLIDQCNTTAWEKRLKAIGDLQEFAETNQKIIRNTAASNFIKLVDAYCCFLQDNNLKVQTKAQQSFEAMLQNQDLSALWNSNLTMICSALTQNICSTNGVIKNQGDRLMDLIEEVVIAESRGNANNLIQPLVSQLTQNQNKSAKPVIVDRLCNLIERVDKISIIERYLQPLIQPSSKLSQEANQNAQLKQALQRLQLELQNVELGIGVGLK